MSSNWWLVVAGSGLSDVVNMLAVALILATILILVRFASRIYGTVWRAAAHAYALAPTGGSVKRSQIDARRTGGANARCAGDVV
ncbi:MAG: hypothetical protein ACJ75Q_12510 [Gaiellaceae bacterium]